VLSTETERIKQKRGIVMGTQFTAVKLAKIEQGGFLRALEDAFEKFSRDFAGYIEEEGAAGTFSGKVVATIEVKYSKKAIAIITDVTTKMPAKSRDGYSTAFIESDPEHDNRRCLFAQETGTSATHPEQGVLCGDGGEDLSHGSK
jgi:hypothetical protein